MNRRQLLMGVAASGLAGCQATQTGMYFSDGIYPPVTQLYVQKSERKLHLLNGEDVLKSYRIGLGFNPVGHKQEQGDGRTPEGLYRIDRRNPDSSFYLSLGINYPNRQDRAKAYARGVNPGGDIFIHGMPSGGTRKSSADWTWGCIAVSNPEIIEIYNMVPIGTPIYIAA